MHKIHIIVLSIFITACLNINSANNIKKHYVDSISSFNKMLAKEYKDFADTAFKDGMWLDYIHFKNKSRNAALGKDVSPEDIAKWKSPESEINNLIWARGRLNDFTIDSVKATYPYQLAHSQMLFDCWVERAARKMQPEKIEECRMDFVLEMASLENHLIPVH